MTLVIKCYCGRGFDESVCGYKAHRQGRTINPDPLADFFPCLVIVIYCGIQQRMVRDAYIRLLNLSR